MIQGFLIWENLPDGKINTLSKCHFDFFICDALIEQDVPFLSRLTIVYSLSFEENTSTMSLIKADFTLSFWDKYTRKSSMLALTSGSLSSSTRSSLAETLSYWVDIILLSWKFSFEEQKLRNPSDCSWTAHPLSKRKRNRGLRLWLEDLWKRAQGDALNYMITAVQVLSPCKCRLVWLWLFLDKLAQFMLAYVHCLQQVGGVERIHHNDEQSRNLILMRSQMWFKLCPLGLNVQLTLDILEWSWD